MIYLINLILGFCIFALLMLIAGCACSDQDHKTKRFIILVLIALIIVIISFMRLANMIH